MSKKEFLKAIIIMFIVVIVASVSIVSVLYFIKNSNKEEETIKSPYSTKAIQVMNEYGLFEDINGKYSKVVEKMLEEKEFKAEYLESYYEIEYKEISGFTKKVNELLSKGYDTSDINYILGNLKEDLDIVLSMERIDLTNFKTVKNFDIEKLERYLKYAEEKELDWETVVTYVNIGLDLPGYSEFTSYTTEEAQNNLAILVNKYHKLPDDYEPDDLVLLSYNNAYKYKLRKEAAEAFEELTKLAVSENVIFYPFSAYRSYETQNGLYNNYKARDGEKNADTYSARPAFSEHQLGLAVDVRSNTLPDNLTPEHYAWMLDNSYKYGFIVRYPKGKQHITQYIEEPWHIRYLGVDLATKVHNSNLTYDEYYDLYIEHNNS